MIIGVGLDVTEIERFAMDDKAQLWFRRRIFTAGEWTYAQSKRHWPQHLAGCFAAKEAFRKALGKSVPWRSIGVTHAASGAPQFWLDESIRKELQLRKIDRVHLTITHSRHTAAAMVLFEGPALTGGL